MNRRFKNNRAYVGMLFLSVILMGGLLAGCAATKQARSVKTSGFLGDYSLLQEGAKGEALLTYKNPKADWPAYQKIQLDPVVIWRRGELKNTSIPAEDLQRVANNFFELLKRELSKEFDIVSAPGPRTLRVQVALTDLETSYAALDTVTSVIPVGIALSTASDFVTGKPSFTGEVSIEVKVTDARTSDLLAAAVDRRVGGETIEASVDNWDDVNKIMEFWSQLFRFRLCQLRGQSGCSEPVE